MKLITPLRQGSPYDDRPSNHLDPTEPDSGGLCHLDVARRGQIANEG